MLVVCGLRKKQKIDVSLNEFEGFQITHFEDIAVGRDRALT
jgi:hypothetical protein